MEIVEEQNPLHVLLNPRLTNNKIIETNLNIPGRPKKKYEIKFGPQPKSIISQILQKERSSWKNKRIEKRIIGTYDISDINGEPEIKKHVTCEGVKSYQCEYPSCTYSTTSSSNMIKHKRRHTSEKPYMCDQCTFRTNFINSLTVHKRIHSGERPFICEHCCYRCNSSSNLKKHHRHKHSNHISNKD